MTIKMVKTLSIKVVPGLHTHTCAYMTELINKDF